MNNPLHDIPVPAAGTPATRTLTNFELDLIVRGLLIPGQGAGKSMAAELVEARAKIGRLEDYLITVQRHITTIASAEGQ